MPSLIHGLSLVAHTVAVHVDDNAARIQRLLICPVECGKGSLLTAAAPGVYFGRVSEINA